MKWLAILFIAGCTKAPEPPAFFLQKVTSEPDGTVTTWTYQGNQPPPQWQTALLTED